MGHFVKWRGRILDDDSPAIAKTAQNTEVGVPFVFGVWGGSGLSIEPNKPGIAKINLRVVTGNTGNVLWYEAVGLNEGVADIEAFPSPGQVWDSFPLTVGAPDLAKPTERTSIGTTIYLKANARGLPPMTAVYVPDPTALGPQIDVILYFHGDKSAGIDKYLIDSRFKLREEMAPISPPQGEDPRKKKFIFVAPSLASAVQGPPWGTPGTGTELLQHAMNGLKKELSLTSTPTLGRIVLAAHSGGGAAMKAILGDPDVQKNVKEVWCFDCFYGYQMEPAKFLLDNWKRPSAHTMDRLWFYSTGHIRGDDGSERGTLTEAQIVQKAAAGTPPTPARGGRPEKPGTPGLTNVDVTIGGPWMPHNIVPTSHENVPVSCIAKLIKTSTILLP